MNLFNFSPLEQFDDVTWVVYNLVFEALAPYTRYVFELEFDSVSLYSLNGNNVPHLTYMLSGNSLLIVILFFAIIRAIDAYVPLRDFSHFFLLAFIHLFTGSFIFLWFDDFFSDAITLNKTEGVRWSLTNFDYDLVNISRSFYLNPQINFSISWDENFITLLLAFFLLGGSEEEEDEDFLLEEEESGLVEDVVAPLFISTLGKDVEENGALFLKVCGLFGFVFINNVMGMLPYADTGTSSLILTFWIALSVFGSLIYLMIKRNGVNHLFSLFMPSGCPFPLIFLLVPIEFISYTFRLVSLPVRLFANMMAGHTLMKVFIGFSWSMILMGDFFLIANLFPLAVIFVLTFLELGVAAVQAYIFTILTCIYLKDIFQAH